MNITNFFLTLNFIFRIRFFTRGFSVRVKYVYLLLGNALLRTETLETLKATAKMYTLSVRLFDNPTGVTILSSSIILYPVGNKYDRERADNLALSNVLGINDISIASL